MKNKRKLNQNKIYAFIGRAVIFCSLHIGIAIGIVYAFLECTTVYR